MDILSFCAMCFYVDVSHLNWSNVRYETDSSSFEIIFEIIKNAQYRKGNKMIVSATIEEACLLRLLRSLSLKSVANSDGNDFIFRGFNGSLVAKNQGKTSPMITIVRYAQYMRYISLLFNGIWSNNGKM
jgi:hypothetical protein